MKHPVKYVVCVPDGCADEPVGELGGRTPLEVAQTPVLKSLAARGEVGRAKVIPDGMPPGSDVGNMSILGYDPAQYHTGRAPIEAAALGLKLSPEQVAFRCNLVRVESGVMADFAGGHPSTEQAVPVIHALNEYFTGGASAHGLGTSAPRSSAPAPRPRPGVSFHAGVQYRHIMVAPKEWLEVECVPPHDLTDQPVVLPSGPQSKQLCQMMEESQEVLRDFDLPATQIWLWGQGFQPQMPSFQQQWGVSAGLVTAVDLVRGLGILTDMKIVEVEGATAWYDTNYEGKRDAALQLLGDGADLAVIHVEASDEAGHAGNVQEKVRSLENWDSRILDGLVKGLEELGPWRMLLMPDHATPLELRTHTSDPVPWLIVDSETQAEGGEYTERGVAEIPAVSGVHPIRKLLQQ